MVKFWSKFNWKHPWIWFCHSLGDTQSPMRKETQINHQSQGISKHNTWWRHQMETFSVLLAIWAGNSPVPGELNAQRPVTRSFDVFFDLRLNKWLTEQSWGWWFEMLSRPLWRHCNDGWISANEPVCLYQSTLIIQPNNESMSGTSINYASLLAVDPEIKFLRCKHYKYLLFFVLIFQLPFCKSSCTCTSPN